MLSPADLSLGHTRNVATLDLTTGALSVQSIAHVLNHVVLEEIPFEAVWLPDLKNVRCVVRACASINL